MSLQPLTVASFDCTLTELMKMPKSTSFLPNFIEMKISHHNEKFPECALIINLEDDLYFYQHLAANDLKVLSYHQIDPTKFELPFPLSPDQTIELVNGNNLSDCISRLSAQNNPNYERKLMIE